MDIDTRSTPRIVHPGELAAGLFAFLADRVHVIVTEDILDRYNDLVAEIAKIERIITENKFYRVENGRAQYQALLPVLYTQKIHLEMAIYGYPRRIDLSFLADVQKDGWPAFMVLSLDDDDPIAQIKLKQGFLRRIIETTPKLPPVILQYYQPTTDKLIKKMDHQGASEVSITAQGGGIMPPETKVEIEKAIRSELFSSIFIISEAPTWKVNVVIPKVKRLADSLIDTVVKLLDPLVIGITSWGEAYLIDDFYPTDLEKAVLEKHVYES